jgi:hypothetical protein
MITRQLKTMCPGLGPDKVNHNPVSGRPMAEPLSLGDLALWMTWCLLLHVLLHVHATCLSHDAYAVSLPNGLILSLDLALKEEVSILLKKLCVFMYRLSQELYGSQVQMGRRNH